MKARRFVIASDTHGDQIDPVVEEKFFAWMKDWKPEIRIHAGDMFDFAAIRNGASQEEKSISMADDYKAGMKFAKRFFADGETKWYLRGNHSLSDETDLLTENGWKPVKECTDQDQIAQFDSATGRMSFSKPMGLVHHHEDFIYEIEGRYSKQAVSSLHDVVLHGKKFKAVDLLGQKIKEDAVRVTGDAGNTATEDHNWLRLLTWVVTDGCIVNLVKYNPGTIKARVQFKLSFDKKITSLRGLLDEMGVRYTFRPCKKTGLNKLQPYYIRIYGDDARDIVSRLGGKKRFPCRWSRLNPDCYDVVAHEIEQTDGSPTYLHTTWVSIDRHNMDVMQEWAVRTGRCFAYKFGDSSKSGFANGQTQYSAKFMESAIRHWRTKLRIEKKAYGRLVYCVTMPAGTIVTRIHGKVAFTGNCERLWELRFKQDGVLQEFAEQKTREIENKMRDWGVRMLPYDARKGVLRIGKLQVLHGYKSGINATRQHATIYRNCIHGHDHAQGIVPVENLDGPALAMGTGCMCVIDMPYNQRQTNKLRHQQGWVYGMIYKDGTYQAFQAKRVGDNFNLASHVKTY